MGLPKSDFDGEVTVLQGVKLHCGIQYGLSKGDPNGEVTVRRGSTVVEPLFRS